MYVYQLITAFTYSFLLGESTPYLISDTTNINRPENNANADPEVLTLHDVYNFLPKAKVIVLIKNPTKR